MKEFNFTAFVNMKVINNRKHNSDENLLPENCDDSLVKSHLTIENEISRIVYHGTKLNSEIVNFAAKTWKQNQSLTSLDMLEILKREFKDMPDITPYTLTVLSRRYSLRPKGTPKTKLCNEMKEFIREACLTKPYLSSSDINQLLRESMPNKPKLSNGYVGQFIKENRLKCKLVLSESVTEDMAWKIIDIYQSFINISILDIQDLLYNFDFHHSAVDTETISKVIKENSHKKSNQFPKVDFKVVKVIRETLKKDPRCLVDHIEKEVQRKCHSHFPISKDKICKIIRLLNLRPLRGACLKIEKEMKMFIFETCKKSPRISSVDIIKLMRKRWPNMPKISAARVTDIVNEAHLRPPLGVLVKLDSEMKHFINTMARENPEFSASVINKKLHKIFPEKPSVSDRSVRHYMHTLVLK